MNAERPKGPPVYEVRLVSARELGPNVRELELERTDGAPMTFEAGQWISLVLPLPEGEARRSYSIASPPDGTARFRIAVTRVEGGPGSTYLHGLAVGDALRCVGPQGFFTRLPTATHPSLFVATGTGVTPLYSMIRAALAAGSTARMHLVFGVRREEDRIYRAELEALAAAHPNFTAEYTLSRAADGWTGKRGYVQDHVREAWEVLGKASSEPPHAYICGLQRMVGAVRDLLRKDLEAARQQVHSERYD